MFIETFNHPEDGWYFGGFCSTWREKDSIVDQIGFDGLGNMVELIDHTGEIFNIREWLEKSAP